MKTLLLLVGLVAVAAGPISMVRAEAPPPYLATWGSYGSGPGQFIQPAGIAIDNGLVYVADQWNDRVQVLTLGGVFVREWAADLQDNPTGIAIGPSGTVYVSMHHTHLVKLYSATGVQLGQIGGAGPVPGRFLYPVGVATDAAGNLYVADRDNNRIQKFTAEGAFLLQWGGVVRPVGVAVSTAGLVYVTDDSSAPVSVFSQTGDFIASWGTLGSGPGQLVAADGLTFDAAGNVLIADGGSNSRVAKFTAAGDFLTQWGGFGTGLGQFQYPGDVAVDGNGSVYVTDWMNHRIQVFGAGATPTKSKTWGSMKAEYR